MLLSTAIFSPSLEYCCEKDLDRVGMSTDAHYQPPNLRNGDSNGKSDTYGPQIPP